MEMHELFLDYSGIVHMQFIPEGLTVNKPGYKILCCPELWHRKNWLLLHGNAPTHRSVLVQEELAKQQVTVLPHPPYSPDFAPCDFLLFPCLKEMLCRHQFQSAAREAIWDLPTNTFQQCFQ
jgi:hypothetical protein